MANSPIQDPSALLPAGLLQKLTDARTLHTQNEAKLAGLLPTLRKIAGLDPYTPAAPPATNERNDLGTDFRPQLLEPLLQQASQLLASLLTSQRSYRQLKLQQLNLAVDVLDLDTLKQINDDETSAQVYYAPFWDGQAQVDASKAAQDGNTQLGQLFSGQKDAQKLAAAWMVENSAVPFATNNTGGTIGNHGSQLKTKPSAPSAGEEVNQFGGALPTNGALLGALLAYRAADYSFQVAIQQLAAQSAPVAARDPYLGWRATALAAEASFRERRRDAAFDKLVYKLSQIVQPTGSRNVAELILEVGRRAADDVANTYARLQRVRDGMKLLFNHDCDPLPAAPGASFDLGTDYLDSLVAWTRHVALVLNRQLLPDQPHVHRVSLKSRLGQAQFDVGRNNRYWTLVLTAADYSNMFFMRLRGVSVWYAGETTETPSFVITAPHNTQFVYRGAAPSNAVQTLDRCPIGRPLQFSKSEARGDVYGSAPLFNGSPLGTWRIDSSASAKLDGIDDIILDLYSNVQY
jgi:hypothetical protein